MLDPDAPRQDTHGLWAVTAEAAAMPRAHRHDELELNYVVRGSMTYLIGSAVVTLPARRLAVVWGPVPHQMVGPGSDEPRPEVIWAFVPLPLAMAWDLPEALMRQLLRHGVAVESGENPRDQGLLEQWLVDLGTPDADRSARHASVLEIEARLRRLATRLEPWAEPAATSASDVSDPAQGATLTGMTRSAAGEIPAAVERMARFIAIHYREPITVEDAARAAHVHPHYAMTLFRQHTGLTLNNYLTLQRIAHANRLLTTTRRPILDIAFESGFGSVSRFYEAFKAQTGASPRQFRLRQARLPGMFEKAKPAGRRRRRPGG